MEISAAPWAQVAWEGLYFFYYVLTMFAFRHHDEFSDLLPYMQQPKCLTLSFICLLTNFTLPTNQIKQYKNEKDLPSSFCSSSALRLSSRST